jgi:hypothetical protein
MRDYRATALHLAEAHRREDPGTAQIFLIPDPARAAVRLVEISTSAPRSGDVMPFTFESRPDLDIPFPSTVILLNPEEWEDVLKGDLEGFPAGWVLAAREEI